MIKLLALDLDGTVLNSSGQISDANICAIKAAEDSGVLVTIATGRRFRDAHPVGIQLELNAPLITHNGALTKFAHSLETVDSFLLKSEVSYEIIRAGKEFGGDALLSTDPHGKGTLLYDRVSDDNIPLQKYLKWSKSLHGEKAESSIHHVNSLEEVLHEHDVIHISFSGTCAAMEDLKTILEEELGDSVTLLATVYPSLNFTLLDILPHDASKGVGVGRLAKLYNVDREEMMAIGDNFNDLHMLEAVGTPVIMGNAGRDLLERPEFYKTLTNDENGVAYAIRRYILNQEN